MQKNFELAGVVRRFGKQLVEQEKLSPEQIKALYHILQCRTATLAAMKRYVPAVVKCDTAITVVATVIALNARGQNRQALWTGQLIQTTLPVKHYHLVFTVPHCLNKICLWDSGTF
jgi:hypothetical protein